MDWDLDYDAAGQNLTLTSSTTVVQVSMTPGVLHSLSRITETDWAARRSLQAGTTLGHSVFWCLGEQPGTVQVLVGHDDETWELAVTLPLSVVADVADRGVAEQ